MEKYKMVSLIPARGGSKRVPHKNIKMMAGKPMLAWTIEASLKSKYIDRTFVSTEDPVIKEVALKYGAEVIDRPVQYASDTIDGNSYEHDGIISSFKEVLWKMKYKPDYFCWLYCCFPTRTSKQIDEAFELMIERRCTRVMTAHKMGGEAYEYFSLDKNDKAVRDFDYTKKQLYLRSLGIDFQEPRYEETGHTVIMRYRDIGLHGDINYADSTLYIIDKKVPYIDVNTPLEFAVAECILKERMERGGGK